MKTSKKDNVVNLFTNSDNKPTTFKGSGSGGGGMEERFVKIETDIEYIKRDIADIKVDLKHSRKENADQFKNLNNKFSTDLKHVEDKLSNDLKAYKTENTAEFKELNRKIDNIPLVLAKFESSILKWFFATSLTMISLTFFIAKFFFSTP